MDKENLIQFIQNLLPMSSAKADDIVVKFKSKTICKNDFLSKSGRVCNEYLFIESGIMRSYTYDTTGHAIISAFYLKNTFISDLQSFFNKTPANEYIQATTDCEIWYITYLDMQSCFHTISEFREFTQLNLVYHYGILKKRMLSNLQETAEKRYCDMINSNPEIIQNIPLKDIASYLGITHSSLSRIRKLVNKEKLAV
jgi:CRP-like cAMP-binding protein